MRLRPREVTAWPCRCGGERDTPLHGNGGGLPCLGPRPNKLRRWPSPPRSLAPVPSPERPSRDLPVSVRGGTPPPHLVGAPSKTWRAGQWPPTPYLGAAPPRSPMGCAGPGPPVVPRSTASRAHPRRVPGTGRSFEAAARRPSGRSVLPPKAAGEFAFKGAAPWAWDPRGPLAPHWGCAGRCVTSPPASKRVGSNTPRV